MDVRVKNKILAAVVLIDDKDKVQWGIPVFLTDDESEQAEVAMLLARITFSMVHDLKNGVLILVSH